MDASKSIFSKITSSDGINYLNIGLMLISVIAAYILPFELFLFSYAILGPLHYLTEISWLDKKNYFIKSKIDIWLLVVLVLLISYGVFDSTAKTNSLTGTFMFLGFVYGLVILFIEKTGIKLFLIVLIFSISQSINLNSYPDLPFLLFVVWLPTMLHVYVFTGAFILFGALKSKSTSGILSLVIFIMCAFTFFIFMPESFGITVTEYGKQAYSLFRILNITLYKLFGFGSIQGNDAALFFGPKAIAIMRFIAFAYTYHYLNWFSKTSVIKWNDISKRRMAVILTLWIASVALYLYDYKIGFYALFLLSMLHVFLEFPLNHHTFIGIGKEVKTMLKK